MALTVISYTLESVRILSLANHYCGDQIAIEASG